MQLDWNRLIQNINSKYQQQQQQQQQQKKKEKKKEKVSQSEKRFLNKYIKILPLKDALSPQAKCFA